MTIVTEQFGKYLDSIEHSPDEDIIRYLLDNRYITVLKKDNFVYEAYIYDDKRNIAFIRASNGIDTTRLKHNIEPFTILGNVISAEHIKLYHVIARKYIHEVAWQDLFGENQTELNNE